MEKYPTPWVGIEKTNSLPNNCRTHVLFKHLQKLTIDWATKQVSTNFKGLK